MIIDVHAHFFPERFLGLLERHLRFEGVRYYAYTPGFTDVDRRRALMDDAGVDLEILSLAPPMVYWAEPGLALALAQAFNDEVAALVRRHPRRFAGMAAVPLGAAALHDDRLDVIVGFSMETVLAIGRLTLGGVLDACPDLTLLYSRPALLTGLLTVGAGHLYNGSDAPFFRENVARTVPDVAGFDLIPAADRAVILGGDARTLFGL